MITLRQTSLRLGKPYMSHRRVQFRQIIFPSSSTGSVVVISAVPPHTHMVRRGESYGRRRRLVCARLSPHHSENRFQTHTNGNNIRSYALYYHYYYQYDLYYCCYYSIHARASRPSRTEVTIPIRPPNGPRAAVVTGRSISVQFRRLKRVRFNRFLHPRWVSPGSRHAVPQGVTENRRLNDSPRPPLTVLLTDDKENSRLSLPDRVSFQSNNFRRK